ncbi:aldo/keto reductase [Novosphingobium sp. 1949]|uniref:Aldo/keto reductase n=1 Tax=Novosphingobium organovorum TaxID=2930092 RepID=A0ABT0B9B8_9SPHN|nr:aldo/keto reductase [Novosphingobium organovorum]MCJ2181598.1 aldo/keto reductase [Novosphingobium organovorum]
MTTQLELAPTVQLSGGAAMPCLGLGTWPLKGQAAADAVASAIGLGYRHIDTAENYRNEEAVGEGVRASGLAREDLWLTTKFNREHHSVAGVREACEASLKRLGTDYIDLLLIHWPNPDQDRFVAAFEGLVQLREAGLVRAIGTSNFKPAHLDKLFAAGLVPEVNQIQLDPYHRRDDNLALHAQKGIVTEAWSPIGQGSALLDDPVIGEIAAAHGRTAAQVVLRWHVQQGQVAIPKSANPQRQAQNLAVFDFTLSDAQMVRLDGLGRPDPDMLDADRFGH